MMAALTLRMCGHEMTPPVDVRRGRWCLGCRCGVQSAVTSAMAVPKLGAVKVTNTAGCAAMDSGIPWRPPHTPAVTSCHVSCRRHTNPSTTGTQPRGGFCNAPTPCAAGPPRRHRPDGSGGRKTRPRPPSTTNVKPRPPRPADQLAYRQRRRHARDNRPPQRCRRPIAARASQHDRDANRRV